MGHWWSRKPQTVLCEDILNRVFCNTIIWLFIENEEVKVVVFLLGKILRIYSKLNWGINSFLVIQKFPNTENCQCAKQGWRPAVCPTWQRVDWTWFSSQLYFVKVASSGVFAESSWLPTEGLGSPKGLFRVESSLSHSKMGSRVCVSLSLDCRWSTGKGNQLLWAPAPFASLVVIWGNSIFLTYEMLFELWIDCAF